jgi:hypothetical protein
LNVTDQTSIVTSFSSKSELALNLSLTRSALTFMGYKALINTLDVSNSNTPSHVDPTNPVAASYQRAIVEIDVDRSTRVTPVDVWLGNLHTRIVHNERRSAGTIPGIADRVVNVLSVTVVQNRGAAVVAVLPTLMKRPPRRLRFCRASRPVSPRTFPPIPPPRNFATTDFHPFGIWFANATTLYVADEGDGVNTTANALNPNAGLQKWTLSAGTWHLDYTLQNRLGLGAQYSIAGLDPSLYPATDGLRNLTGKVNRDGTVTIFAITSTISNSGDQGADPNRLVSITERLSALP